MKFDEKIKSIKLLDTYGNLLTDKQRETLENYLTYDITLSEIAGMQTSSRQAIFDTVRKTLKALNQFEDKLKLIEKNETIMRIIERVECDASESVKLALTEIKDLL